MSRRPVRALVSLLLVAGATVLAGCAQTVALKPAEGSNDPGCAEVSVQLLRVDEIDGQPRRETNAQATGAWGSPTAVVVRCGVEVLPASELPCVPIDGIFWLRDDSDAPNLVFRSFGREPAVDVAIDTDAVSAGIALGSLSTAVQLTEPNGLECSSVEDTVTGEEGPADDPAAPEPSPGPSGEPSDEPSATPTPSP